MNEILIYGAIGADWIDSDSSVTASKVAEKLAEFDGADAIVRISSGGGDVYEGIAILNTLRAYAGEITVVVESLAASAASFIAVGIGGRVIIRPNAELMIHKAWTLLAGNADDIDKTKADLARQDTKIAAIYAGKAGGELDDWLDRMSAETWYSAEEALDAGLVDGVVDAKPAEPTPVAVAVPRVFAAYKYSSRSVAPAPPVTRRSESADSHVITPPGGQEGNAMSFLNKLAQAMGMNPEDVQAGLATILNEQTAEVPAVITVAYPDEASVVPTGRVRVEPTSEVPEGLTFTVTGTTEGWSAEVDETTGVVTVVSADGSRIGDSGEVTLSVSGTGGDVEFTLVVKVISADQKSKEQAEGETPPEPLVPGTDNVTIPLAMYEEFTKAYALNGERVAELAKRDREAEVDGWVKSGKFPVGLRADAIKAMETNPEEARRLWGGLPDGTVPRGEVGYSKVENKDTGEPVTKEDKVAAAMARANELAQKRK